MKSISWALVKVYVCLIFLLAPQSLHAQYSFTGILFSIRDSAKLPYAAVNVPEINQSTLTDSNGKFSFNVPDKFKSITLNVSCIGLKTSILYTPTHYSPEKIYLDISPNQLNEFAFKGLSAREVVEKAVASIPLNYEDSSYFCYSYFRRYEKVNKVFQNFFEALPVVMFKISRGNKVLESTESFANLHARKSKIIPNMTTDHMDNAQELLKQNPIYHLDKSALLPGKFNSYNFSFDTSNKSDDYVINYECSRASSDTHGVMSYSLSTFGGESHEKGSFIIERGSFAIKKIKRTSLRYFDYDYPPFNYPPNILKFSYHKFLFFFIDGDLEAEYVPYNGKWYLKKIARQYTNQFKPVIFETTDFTITNIYEWYADSVSRFITPDYGNNFFPGLTWLKDEYDPKFWDNVVYPWHYDSKEAVFNHLSRRGPLDKQFQKECDYHNDKVDYYSLKRK